MKVQTTFVMAVLTLHFGVAIGQTHGPDAEPNAEYWEPCTGTELRCVQRDAYELGCPSPVTISSTAVSDNGEHQWYASSRHGGGNVRVPEGLFAYKFSVENVSNALEMYAAWKVSNINKCELDAFIRCHFGQLRSGPAEACRQWAAEYSINDRDNKLGTCTLENGVTAYRSPRGDGDCKWTPPDDDEAR